MIMKPSLRITHRIVGNHHTGIVVEAYSPLGTPGNPFRKEDGPNVMDNPAIKEVAEKHKVTVAQVGIVSNCLCI